MTFNLIVLPLVGGALIGSAVTLMLYFNGRVTGISGIIAGGLTAPRNDTLWRVVFVIGLLVGGFILNRINSGFFANTLGRGLGTVFFAGLLVGYGTVMGGGCTSGHGVCGISRFSTRSLLATGVFILFGFLTVTIIRFFFGGGV